MRLIMKVKSWPSPTNSFKTCIFSSYAGYLHIACILFYHLYIVCIVSIEALLFLFFQLICTLVPWNNTPISPCLIPAVFVSNLTPVYPSQLSQILQKTVPRCLTKRHHPVHFIFSEITFSQAMLPEIPPLS